MSEANNQYTERVTYGSKPTNTDDHPNQAYKKIEQSERDGGLCWDRDVPEGATVIVETKNSTYMLEKREGQCWISGGTRFPTPVLAELVGSTWGGSMVKIRFIGIGMFLECYAEGNTLLTTSIRSVKMHQTAS